MSLALAPSSRKSYLKTVQEFFEFLSNYGLPKISPTPYDHIAKFCIYSRRRGLAPRSIRSKLAALAYWLKAQGFPDHTNDFRLHKLLAGWSREHGHQPDNREPLTPNILKGLRQTWAQVCSSSYEQLLFHSAALIAFFGALRVSELVATGKTDGSLKALLLSDVKLTQQGLQIFIRSSKTDQRGRGTEVSLAHCEDGDICPVRAVTEFMSARGVTPGYFFIHKDGFPLTRYQFWALTNKALKVLGLQQHKFGTHSFRIGAASTAARLGYGAERIKSLGRWKSESYKGYIRPVAF
ncbi:integrase/recombinase xerD homolog [Anolis sagrei]|uniref:integrase/recombinase xerD homolog n=1 Tax=Anolis sagrei TaxID=38937 RepID=UPI003522A069